MRLLISILVLFGTHQVFAAQKCDSLVTAPMDIRESIRAEINERVLKIGVAEMVVRTSSYGDIRAGETMPLMTIENGLVEYRMYRNDHNKQLWIWFSDIQDASGVIRTRYLSLIDEDKAPSNRIVEFSKLY